MDYPGAFLIIFFYLTEEKLFIVLLPSSSVFQYFRLVILNLGPMNVEVRK